MNGADAKEVADLVAILKMQEWIVRVLTCPMAHMHTPVPEGSCPVPHAEVIMEIPVEWENKQ